MKKDTFKYNTTSTNMSAFTNAKLVIDNIAITGNNYANSNRVCLNLTFPIKCMPCLLYSTIVRLICCPFQCLLNRDVHCNPLFALLVDSNLSMNSDKCLFTKWKTDNKKLHIDSKLLSEDECKELIVYASEKIEGVRIVKTKYSIADSVSDISYRLSFRAYATPDHILNLAKKYKK